MTRCIDRGWITTTDPRYQPIGIWTITSSLLHGKGSSFSKAFPPITSVPFDAAMKITQDVLGKILKVAIKQTGARLLHLTYGPGTEKGQIIPMASLEIQAPRDAANAVMGIIGYLAQLETVRGYKLSDCPDCRYAVDILQTAGHELASPAVHNVFCQALANSAPQAEPHLVPIEYDGQPGVRVINVAQCWTSEDFAAITSAGDAASSQTNFTTALDRLVVPAFNNEA